MKKSKFILVSLLIGMISIISSGCSAKSNMKTNTDGSGTFSCKYSIEKKIYTEKNYTKISSSQELVQQLKKKVPKGTDLKFNLDTKSSKTEDIITASFTYSSIAEFEKKITALSNAIDESDAGSTLDKFNLTEKDLEKYADIYDTKKVISNSLANYLKKNNIKYDTNSANFKLLVSEIDSIINDENISSNEENNSNSDDYDDEDYDYTVIDDDDEDYGSDDEATYLAKIIKSNNKTTLRVSMDALMTLDDFITTTISEYITVKLDMDTIMKDTLTQIAELDEKACTELFNKVKLADAIKKIDLNKVDATTPVTNAPTKAPKDNTTVTPTEAPKNNTTVTPTEPPKNNTTVASTEAPKVTVSYDIDKLTEAQIKSIFSKEFKASLVKTYLELTDKYLDDILSNSFSSLNSLNSTDANALKNFTYTIDFAGTKQTYTILDLYEKVLDDEYISVTIPNKLGANQLDETPKTGDNSYGSHLLLVSFLLMTSIIIFKKVKQN